MHFVYGINSLISSATFRQIYSFHLTHSPRPDCQGHSCPMKFMAERMSCLSGASHGIFNLVSHVIPPHRESVLIIVPCCRAFHLTRGADVSDYYQPILREVMGLHDFLGTSVSGDAFYTLTVSTFLQLCDMQHYTQEEANEDERDIFHYEFCGDKFI